MVLKVAIVGCGKIADGHVEEVRKMPELACVTAVCDLESLMAEQLARRYSIPAYYGDFEMLLNKERPDVVHIATPPASHLALARMALTAGCHLYIEKPLTLNLRETEELIRLANEADRKLTVGYSYLFDPPSLEAHKLVNSGYVGDIVHIESSYGYNLAGPFGAAMMGDAMHWVHRLPGKLIHNNIDHLLYRVTEYLPDDRPDIHAKGFVRRTVRYGDHRDDLLDELRVMVSGANATANVTFTCGARPTGYITRIYGSVNTLHVDHTNHTLIAEASSYLPGAFGRIAPAFHTARRYLKQGIANVGRFRRADFHYFAGLNTLLGRFYQSIQDGTEEPVPYRDILRISWMIDEIIQQTAGNVANL